jgi:hypothetical protein
MANASWQPESFDLLYFVAPLRIDPIFVSESTAQLNLGH